MRKLLSEYPDTAECRVESAAVSSEELGNPVYPPVRRILTQYGFDCSGKSARRIRREDYRIFDLIIGMDRANVDAMIRFFDGDPDHKISKLMDWSDTPGNVEDPWYSGNFPGVWNEIRRGCNELLNRLKSGRKKNAPPQKSI